MSEEHPDAADATGAMDTPWRRDLATIEAGLTRWARDRRGGATVTDLRMPGSGMANDTVLFRLAGEPVVARLAPAPDSAFPTFPAFDLGFQAEVMELVRTRTAVPVPEVVHHEISDEWLRSPFLVVRAMEGEVASDMPLYLVDPDGWFVRGSAEDRRRLEVGTVRLFVELHRVPDAGEDTAFLRVDAPGDTALARLLASHHAYYEWAREGITIPTLERAYETLRATLPANDRSVVLWGDGRPGNILYRDFEPVGALDWEMAGVGPPEADVAWTTFFHRFFADMTARTGGGEVPAMFQRDEIAAVYERAGGVPLDDLTWYELLAGYRFGIILVRMMRRGLAYGGAPLPEDPDDLMVFAPLLREIVAEVL